MKLGRIAFWSLLSVCCVATLGHAQPMDCLYPDVIAVSSNADTIFVEHQNATRNCCSTLTVDVATEDLVVDFVEGEAGEFCTCMCCFHMGYDANGFEAGHYLVRVWFEGDLVGEEEVDVEGPGSAPVVGAVAKGECMTLASTPEPDEVRVRTWGHMRTGFLSR
jgi:hypothetical protein